MLSHCDPKVLTVQDYINKKKVKKKQEHKKKDILYYIYAGGQSDRMSQPLFLSFSFYNKLE